nr:MAG TPA: hypothetical protein [Caudoviricetes sp.]
MGRKLQVRLIRLRGRTLRDIPQKHWVRVPLLVAQKENL